MSRSTRGMSRLRGADDTTDEAWSSGFTDRQMATLEAMLQHHEEHMLESLGRDMAFLSASVQRLAQLVRSI